MGDASGANVASNRGSGSYPGSSCNCPFNTSTTSALRIISCRYEMYQTETRSSRLNHETASVQREIQRPHVARLIGVQQSDANRRLMAHVLTTFTCSRSDNKFTWKGQWSLSAIERDIFVNHAAAEYIFRPKDSFNMCSLDFLSCCPLAILSQSE